jgi:hypothetical protein
MSDLVGSRPAVLSGRKEALSPPPAAKKDETLLGIRCSLAEEAEEQLGAKDSFHIVRGEKMLQTIS